MPTYLWRCASCGAEDDVLAPIEHRDDPIDCETCGQTMHRVIKAAAPTGILPSKPFKIGAVNRTFETNAEWRQFATQKEAQGMKILDVKDNAWDKFYSDVRNKADTRAKARGFRDWDHSKRERGADMAHRRELEREQKKVGPGS